MSTLISTFSIPSLLAIKNAHVQFSHRSGEEFPRGYIVLSSASSSTKPQDVANWLAKRVAPHKRLTGGIVQVDEVPKNPSGKILRKILRERAAKEVGDREPTQSRL